MGISERIKYLRDLHSLTQAELGKIAGVSDKAVSTWENGSAEPRMGAVQKMSEYFGVSKGWLIGESPLDDNSPVLVCSDENERRLLALYRSLNDIGKRKALENIGDLAQIEKYIRVAEGNRNAV